MSSFRSRDDSLSWFASFTFRSSYRHFLNSILPTLGVPRDRSLVYRVMVVIMMMVMVVVMWW